MEPTIEAFNALQNQLIGPGSGQLSGKQIFKDTIADMLMQVAVPHFAGKLKDSIGDDAFNQLADLINDPANIGSNLINFAKSTIKSQVINPLKADIQGRLKQYVPELGDLDLENMSLSDLQTTVKNGIMSRIKSNIPKELADVLPDNWDMTDLPSALTQVGQDTALSFAKANLPPDVYNGLVANADVLRDPSKIANYISDNLENAKGEATNIVSNMRQNAIDYLGQAKQAISSQVSQQLEPFRSKITELESARDALKDQYNQTRAGLNNEANALKAETRSFRTQFPDAPADDPRVLDILARRADIQNRADAAFRDFTNNDSDLSDQITAGLQKLDSVATDIAGKVQNLSSLKQLGQVSDFVKSNITTLKNDASAAIGTQNASTTELIEQPATAISEGIAGLERRATQLTTEEIPSVFQRFATKFLKRPLPERKLAKSQQAIQDMDPEDIPLRTSVRSSIEPVFQAQSQAQAIRSAGTMQPQEVLPRIQSEIEPVPAEPIQPAEQEPIAAPSEQEPIAAPSEQEPIAAPKPVPAEAGEAGEALEDVAAAGADIPGVDIITSILGIVGSIFAVKALTNSGQPKIPIQTGGSFEPDL